MKFDLKSLNYISCSTRKKYLRKENVKGGIQTHAWQTRLLPQHNTLDQSAIHTLRTANYFRTQVP